MIDEAIRARDALLNNFPDESYLIPSEKDRRTLLREYDALTAEIAALNTREADKKRLSAVYVLLAEARELLHSSEWPTLCKRIDAFLAGKQP